MYTCQKCHKKYESKSIPHFLDNYFCDNCFFKGSKEIVQEQYWSTDNENKNFKKVEEMYKKHNENVKNFLEKTTLQNR
ncbi:hypothetical protein D6D54_09215 [Spiroplasma poulsonii]|uniref:Zinc ribbon domain-containing protein n=1 Tax=Spiroplasma poulsonii TaxID=2138 RepID=A0A433EL51_9MOLU|nr:hypothetical protein [Spiroplasma poulsonii]MBW3059301.1 hypothetical protein [Spiroplasma poulsonii]RUP74927.1 hypothetical protein D6D54_09215 [Spiroplasma poulsonii]